ncbi:MAG TPA: ATP-binding protein [Archangium sp.]|uniref:sensor histidine kinase n=1 Tax=Archangium sp. TaxID=1872627 RepID=UPI002E32AC27|nr:ATP-binding protein [Archangium sp.]HEX5745840.1 ATP-binding protein [Archangium sp.]
MWGSQPDAEPPPAPEAHRESDSERMLRTLLGNLRGVAYRCFNQPHYPLLYASPGVLELTGYGPEDFTASHVFWRELIHPEDVRQVWETIQVALASRTAFTLTYRIHTRTGEERWVCERGVGIGESPEGVAILEGFITDITAFKRAEQRQGFLSSVSETLASSLDYEDTLAHVVQRAVPVLGEGCLLDMAEPEGVLRRLAVAHVDPARAELAWELARSYPQRLDDPAGAGAVIRTGRTELQQQLSEEQFVQYARDARHLELLRGTRVTSMLTVPLRARGRTLGALTFFHCHPERRYGPEDQLLAEDMARRAALAMDNARLYREAQLAVQLRDEFLSVASHELKTPLTPLHLKLTALSRDLPRCGSGDAHSEALQRHVMVAQRQVHKMSTLINALLDVSRLSRGKLKLEPENTDLGDVLSEVTAWFSSEAARVGSELHVEAEAHVTGWWDRLRLEQVVSNLISNAIRYGAGQPIHARVEAEGDRVRLVVRDEGIGISPEAQERIFGKFERAVSERHSGGLGLGLYITRSIVEAMGGTIRVDSRPSEGSTFTVELPRGADGSRGAQG